jgi:hypothetical protein
MRKNIVLVALLFAFFGVRADEGMYIPTLLNQLDTARLSQMGLRLTPEQIYSVNNASLKDAIVQFGGGCTGEIVSAEGLLFTNHHCGYGAIQSHSTIEHDYLTDGFWAYSKEEELPNPDLAVKFLVRMENVTDAIVAALSDTMSEEIRSKTTMECAKKIEDSAVQGTHYKGVVKSYAEGNEFYLLVYEIFEDVRLVGTPPSSIGKFGADADNWMWPRHTGDFSIFRVYADSNNNPAKYSENNVPYKPKYFLKTSVRGIKDGDFSMILGYPGTTNRFLTSYGVQNEIDVIAPAVVKTRRAKLDVLDKYFDTSDKIRIQYASKYARISNYWKYYIGEEKQLRANRVLETKQAEEKEFMLWAADKSEYASVLSDMQKTYSKLATTDKLNIYFREAIFSGAEIFSMARRFHSLYAALKNGDDISRAVSGIRSSLEDFFEDYDVNVDKDLLSVTFSLYYNDINHHQIPLDFVKMVEKNKKDFTRIANGIFAKTMFCSREKIEAFLNDPKLSVLEKDPAFKWFNTFSDDVKIVRNKSVGEELAAEKRKYVKGVMEMQPYRSIAPDANSTMRFSYGSIKNYSPADAILYRETTTLKGVMEKEDPNNPDFIVPEKLKELYNARDFGVYGDSVLVTCFLSTNDITGGNSGSPMLNGRGELIGLAFDGNWEAMSGDIYFDPVLKRTIAVDIRYVLFIIDKFAGAKNLIDELVIEN